MLPNYVTALAWRRHLGRLPGRINELCRSGKYCHAIRNAHQIHYYVLYLMACVITIESKYHNR